MASKNDVTGDSIATGVVTDAYRNHYDRIFGKKKEPVVEKPVAVSADQVIPLMTDPMGQHWDQPALSEITIDDKTATMSRETFCKLKNYSTTIPSGVYPGKMWKAEICFENSCDDYWELRWFGIVPNDPKVCSRNSRKIMVVNPKPEQEQT